MAEHWDECWDALSADRMVMMLVAAMAEQMVAWMVRSSAG
jgi:hypothetical protein